VADPDHLLTPERIKSEREKLGELAEKVAQPPPGSAVYNTMATRVERFDHSIARFTSGRVSVYGPPSETFAKISAMQALVTHCEHPGVRHALEQICVKVQRLCASPSHEDSAIDIAGYARTISMILDEEAYNASEEKDHSEE